MHQYMVSFLICKLYFLFYCATIDLTPCYMLIFELTSMWLSFSYCPVYLGAIMSNVFLPCMLGNMRFISFTFIKSSFFFLVIIDSSPRFVIKECFYLPPKNVPCSASRKMCYVGHFTKWRWLNLGQVFDTLCFWCDIALKSRTTSRLSCLVLIERK